MVSHPALTRGDFWGILAKRTRTQVQEVDRERAREREGDSKRHTLDSLPVTAAHWAGLEGLNSDYLGSGMLWQQIHRAW